MGNELDEVTGPTNTDGRDVNVIDKQLKVDAGSGPILIEVGLWVLGPAIGFAIGYFSASSIWGGLIGAAIGLVPGVIFEVQKAQAFSYFQKLQQKIQADASQIDNYLENRVIILQNLVKLLEKSIDLDKDVMKTVAAYRGGINPNSDAERNNIASKVENTFAKINVALESYPKLQAQDNIADAMRQNTYLQKEITAARVLYNDTVTTWNTEIYSWPVKIMVASRRGFTTRIPFIASQSMKDAARGTFF
jgi:LemA protein